VPDNIVWVETLDFINCSVILNLEDLKGKLFRGSLNMCSSIVMYAYTRNVVVVSESVASLVLSC